MLFTPWLVRLHFCLGDCVWLMWAAPSCACVGRNFPNAGFRSCCGVLRCSDLSLLTHFPSTNIFSVNIFFFSVNRCVFVLSCQFLCYISHTPLGLYSICPQRCQRNKWWLLMLWLKSECLNINWNADLTGLVKPKRTASKFELALQVSLVLNHITPHFRIT